MQSLYQKDILTLKDKELQLQYMLGGLKSRGNYNCNNFWNCDINCSTFPVKKDKRLLNIEKFIRKHNISNETFLRITRTFLLGKIQTYNSYEGEFIQQLDKLLEGYNFFHKKNLKIDEPTILDTELIKLLIKDGCCKKTKLFNFSKQYSLTATDFVVLAKTSIKRSYISYNGYIRQDLSKDLKLILENNNFYK